MKEKSIKSRIAASIVAFATVVTSTVAGMAIKPQTSASAADYDNFAKELQYSLYFYDGNWCGNDVDENSAFSWRGNCHTQDAVVGGFHDAGDHVKFGLPAGYSASTLGWSYYEYKDVYNSLGQTDHLKRITNHFAEYFKNCTTLSGDSVSSLIYQIGNGNADHEEWCAPEKQGTSSRQVYKTSNGASDIAAEYAAALAVNYINFGNAEDLKYAKALYKFSTQYNTCATDGAEGFYSSYDYYDDQAWAAGWLYLATKDSSYKSFLNTFANSTGKGKSGNSGIQWGIYTTMSWNNVSAGAGILQAEITGSSSDWNKVSAWMDKQNFSSYTSSYYCESEWGSARYNTAMQTLALVYEKYNKNSTKYSAAAKAQMEMILGKNSKNINLVCGMDSNSFKYPHHRAASGFSSNDEFTASNGSYGSNGHTLTGALAGGPKGSDFSSYVDSVKDYKVNEVALDYNATLVSAAAALYSKYKTGSVDSSVNGINRQISDKTTVTTTTRKPATTTTTTKATTVTKRTTTTGKRVTTKATTTTKSVVTTATPSGKGKEISFNTGTQTGEQGDTQAYAEFSTNGAKYAKVYYKVNTNDTTSSGGFGTWNGSEWKQVEFSESVSNGEVVATYAVPSDVGQTVKCMVWYPAAQNVTFEKVVLYNGDSTGDVTTAPSGDNRDATFNTGTQTGEQGDTQAYAEFSTNGAKYAKVYYKVNTNDTTSSGGFGTWNGSEWKQVEFSESVSNGEVVATYAVPSDVGQTVKCMVWYPAAQNVTFEKVVLYNGDSTGNVTTAPSADDRDATFNTGTQTGEQGDTQAYAEFSPNGAKSATVYYKVNTNDTTSSGGFGTWNGSEWEQVEFSESVSNGEVKADYTIPSDVGQTVKCMVWYPAAQNVTFEKIVLHYGGSTKVTTTTTKATTTKKITTTKKTTTTTKKITTTTTSVIHTGWNASATRYGDVNSDGEITITDAVCLNRFLAGNITLNDEQKANADVYKNSKLDAKDCETLLQYLVFVVTKLPVKP